MEQINIFDYMESVTNKPFKIDKPVKLWEFFGGIGSQAMALRDLGIDFKSELVEIDKFAVKSYNAIHGTDFETKDIRDVKGYDLDIDTDKYVNIMCYSFPCQDLSVAGKQKGMKKGSGTRSGLLWEVERILKECTTLPQCLVMENVPAVHSKSNMPDFQSWIDFLESKGYKNYYQDLNAKNFGVAQSRNRCFMISLLGDYSYEFPEPIELDKCMKDYLEDEVDEKYYLNGEKARKLIEELIERGALDKIAETVDALASKQASKQQSTCASRTQIQSQLQTASKQDTTQECQISRQMEAESSRLTAYLNYVKVDQINTDIATTLCARDYKGFGTGFNTMNAVIEVKKGS